MEEIRFVVHEKTRQPRYFMDDSENYGLSPELEKEVLRYQEPILKHLQGLPTPDAMQAQEVERQVHVRGSVYHVIHLSKKTYVRRDYTHDGLKRIVELPREEDSLEDAA